MLDVPSISYIVIFFSLALSNQFPHSSSWNLKLIQFRSINWWEACRVLMKLCIWIMQRIKRAQTLGNQQTQSCELLCKYGSFFLSWDYVCQGTLWWVSMKSGAGIHVSFFYYFFVCELMCSPVLSVSVSLVQSQSPTCMAVVLFQGTGGEPVMLL